MTHIGLWIDQHEARIFHVATTSFDEATLSAPAHHIHRHPKGEVAREHDHPDDEPRFFGEVARALAGEGDVLVAGPSVTKLHLLRYLQRSAPAVEARVVGVETSDHPTDKQFAAHIRAYFHDSPRRVSHRE